MKRGVVDGLLAALLFGLSAPLSKWLLPSVGPWALAGLLYLGAGLGLTLLLTLRRIENDDSSTRVESRIGRGDLPWLAGSVMFGGVLGPLLLLWGLARLDAVSASLLLNLEAPFTILVAVLLFGDHLGRRELLAVLLLIGGAVLLGKPGSLSLQDNATGALLVAGACASWALDNNFTQRLSLRDPLAVVRIKGLCAGAFNVVLASLTGHVWPRPGVMGLALLLGFCSYGLSIVLALRCMRAVGAARQAALFSTAPFFGAALAVPLFGWGARLATNVSVTLLATALMAAGVVLLLLEKHRHVHTHDVLDHDHRHVHDEHHRHAHEGAVVEPHSHAHHHAAITHDHDHAPDPHHRHRH